MVFGSGFAQHDGWRRNWIIFDFFGYPFEKCCKKLFFLFAIERVYNECPDDDCQGAMNKLNVYR